MELHVYILSVIIWSMFTVIDSKNSNNGDLYWKMTKSEYYPEYSTSLIIHASLMTVVAFTAFPLLYLYTMQVQKKYTKTYKSIHGIVIMIVLSSGFYVSLADHLDAYKHFEHHTLGQILMFLLVLLFIFTFIKRKSIRKMHVFILRYIVILFLFPLQWFLGLNSLFLEPQFPYLPRTFYGHFVVGSTVVYFSLFSVWNSSTTEGVERIMYCESFISLFAAIAFIAEITGDRLQHKQWKMDKYQHLMLCSMWFICGLLCVFYRYFNLKSRVIWHHLTIALATFLMGFALINYQLKGANIMLEAAYIHRITGALFITAACFKMFQQNAICGTMGICGGIMLTFANNVLCQTWHFGLKYDANTFALLVVIISGYIAMINFIVYRHYTEMHQEVLVFKEAKEEQEPFIINTAGQEVAIAELP